MKKIIAAGLALIVITALVVRPSYQQSKAEHGGSPAPYSASSVTAEPREPVSGELEPAPHPGVVSPPTVAADDATVSGESPVIGVVVGGQPRAYLLDALSVISSHVVHDTIKGIPITVTFCDITDYARCFTGPSHANITELKLGGFMNGALHFLFRDKYYPHDSPDLPFDQLSFTRTTWLEWRSMHPATDLYIGVQ